MIIFAKDLATQYTERCGVIPYTVDALGNITFLFGIDATHNELSDMGGGVKKKSSETALAGGLREFHEESRGVFSGVTANHLITSLALVDDTRKMSIIFFPIQCTSHQSIIDSFMKKMNDPDVVRKKSNEELSGLEWVSQDAFTQYINFSPRSSARTMWPRIQRFFQRSITNQDSFLCNLRTNARAYTYEFEC